MRCGATACARAIDAVLDEYDAIARRALSGGASATPADFSPPGGAFIVGFMNGVPRAWSWGARCCTSSRTPPRNLGHQVIRLDSTSATWPFYLTAGYHEIANYNDNPHADFWGEKRL